MMLFPRDQLFGARLPRKSRVLFNLLLTAALVFLGAMHVWHREQREHMVSVVERPKVASKWQQQQQQQQQQQSILEADDPVRECYRLVKKALTDLTWICDVQTKQVFDKKWIVDRFSKEEVGNMSNVGRRIFLNKWTKESGSAAERRKKQIRIHVWEFGKQLEPRFLYGYGKTYREPFGSECSVHNCDLQYDSRYLHKADVVLFHFHKMNCSQDHHTLPIPKHRYPGQRWVFLIDESPLNPFLYGNCKLGQFNGLFNWSMGYGIDNDVPVPYGRTTLRNAEEKSDKDHALATLVSTKTHLAVILASNCGGKSRRFIYLNQLRQHLSSDDLHMIGGCAEKKTGLSCPGGFRKDCPAIDKYKFYLAFENSACSEYITEKVWWNAYHKKSVPVALGGISRADYARLAPPHSFLHVDDFAQPGDLARLLVFLGRQHRFYMRFHDWRGTFSVANEHGYFGAPIRHYCRLCEALNFNQAGKKVYDDLEHFRDGQKQCRKIEVIKNTE